MSPVILLLCALVNLSVVSFIYVFPLGYKKVTDGVLIIKVGLQSNLLKSEFKHIENYFLCNKLIQIPLSLNYEAL